MSSSLQSISQTLHIESDENSWRRYFGSLRRERRCVVLSGNPRDLFRTLKSLFSSSIFARWCLLSFHRCPRVKRRHSVKETTDEPHVEHSSPILSSLFFYATVEYEYRQHFFFPYPRQTYIPRVRVARAYNQTSSEPLSLPSLFLSVRVSVDALWNPLSTGRYHVFEILRSTKSKMFYWLKSKVFDVSLIKRNFLRCLIRTLKMIL